jgi:hypothetical protein
MSEMAEPSIGEFEFVLFGGEWIVGEADDLSAVLYAIGVAVMLRGLTVSKDVCYIVSLSAVGIPRFVTR